MRCHTAPSCGLQSMKMVFMGALLSHWPAHLAEPVDVIERVTRAALEHVCIFTVLQLRDLFADLCERHGAAEIDSINGGEDDGGDEQQEQFPHRSGNAPFQECHGDLLLCGFV